MSLSEAKSQVRQFLKTKNSGDLEESLIAALDEVASIEGHSSDLYSEADCNLAYFTGDPDLGSRPIICVYYGRLQDACSVVSKSVPSSVADLLSTAICVVEAIIRKSILRVLVGALETTLSSNSTKLGDFSRSLRQKFWNLMQRGRSYHRSIVTFIWDRMQ